MDKNEGKRYSPMIINKHSCLLVKVHLGGFRFLSIEHEPVDSPRYWEWHNPDHPAFYRIGPFPVRGEAGYTRSEMNR